MIEGGDAVASDAATKLALSLQFDARGPALPAPRGSFPGRTVSRLAHPEAKICPGRDRNQHRLARGHTVLARLPPLCRGTGKQERLLQSPTLSDSSQSVGLLSKSMEKQNSHRTLARNTLQSSQLGTAIQLKSEACTTPCQRLKYVRWVAHHFRSFSDRLADRTP